MVKNEYRLKLPKKILDVFEVFNKKGFDIWMVGGGVRNLLMDKPISDPDFTTNATPEEIQKLFKDSFYDNKFGTVGIPIDDEVYEITTYRTESLYKDRRRPEKVKWGKSLDEDLKRRDFTINAMVIGIKSNSNEIEFVDPFKGEVDMDKKVIRAVGKAGARFGEDALRMMRAIRIGAQLGFKIEGKTQKAINKNAKLINDIASERVRDELIKILKSDFPADGILLLYASGLLQYILPEMLEMRGVKQIGHHIYDVWTHSIESLRGCPSRDPIIRLATLLHDIGKPRVARPRDGKEITFYGHEVVGSRMVNKISDRLRLSKAQKQKMFILVRWHMFAYDTKMTDAAIRRFVRRVGVDNINDMMMLRTGDRIGGGSKATSWRLRELQERVGKQLYEPMSIKDLKIDGKDVMKTLKITPGPRVGEILEKLFEEIIEDTRLNTKEYLLKRAKQLGKKK